MIKQFDREDQNVPEYIKNIDKEVSSKIGEEYTGAQDAYADEIIKKYNVKMNELLDDWEKAHEFDVKEAKALKFTDEAMAAISKALKKVGKTIINLR